MRAVVLLAFELDTAYLESEAMRRGRSMAVVTREFIGAVECDLADTIIAKRGNGVVGACEVRTTDIVGTSIAQV